MYKQYKTFYCKCIQMYYIKNVYNFKERPKNALIYNNNYQNSFY